MVFTLNEIFIIDTCGFSETEADYIGLLLMAQACYDPREAVGFILWIKFDFFRR